MTTIQGLTRIDETTDLHQQHLKTGTVLYCTVLYCTVSAVVVSARSVVSRHRAVRTSRSRILFSTVIRRQKSHTIGAAATSQRYYI